MIYTRLTMLAMKLCFEKHLHQVDKSGVPYPFHPFHVAEEMTDEYSTCAALLHDVMEDTDTTPEELLDRGIPAEVVSALLLLCHQDGVPYMEYVSALCANPIARKVKIADLHHNMDLTRLETVTPWDLERLEKYRKALALLEENEAKKVF